MKGKVNKMKHTPGKWEIRKGKRKDTVSVETDAAYIAEVYGQDYDDGEANARLIAAAPDMLEALKRSMDFAQEILNLLVGYQTEHFNSNINGARGSAIAIMDIARAAIAKATEGR